MAFATLVCDAALGLLTETDRRAGHLAACKWLEVAGETDAIVLVRHAEEGGDRPRAVSFYTRAAEHSLAQHDFVQALACVGKGFGCGAQGQDLCMLRGVQASAFYGQGQWLSEQSEPAT